MGTLEDALDERIRRVLREELQRPLPALVTSRTVTAVVGIPRRRFTHDARAGRYPSWVDRRLVIAKTDDVIAYYAARIKPAAAPATDDESSALARVGARRLK